MTYHSQYEGPLSEPIRNLEKAVDALFNIEKKLKRSGGGYPVYIQRARLDKIIKRLDAKNRRSTAPSLWLRKDYFCEVCKSLNCTHDKPLEEPVLEGPVQSAPRRKR
jgi:hypothetical protein